LFDFSVSGKDKGWGLICDNYPVSLSEVENPTAVNRRQGFKSLPGLKPFAYICKMTHPEEDLQVRWLKLRIKLKEKFNIKPDMNGVLLLIGIQELGQGPQEFSKEQKQDLMHIAICTILMASEYYSFDGHDEEGWPHFTQLKALPEFNMIEQENFLKDHVLLYFSNLQFI
jgi:hypothetical protein